MKNISDIYSRNIWKAIVPAYFQQPYAHFVQKCGSSTFVLLQNLPVGFIFENDPVGLDFTSNLMYDGNDEIIFGEGNKLQNRTGINSVDNGEKYPMQEPSHYKIQYQFHNDECLCFKGDFLNICALVCNPSVVDNIKNQMLGLPKKNTFLFIENLVEIFQSRLCYR